MLTAFHVDPLLGLVLVQGVGNVILNQKMENSRYEKINKYIYPGEIAIPTLRPSIEAQRREEQERRRHMLTEIRGSSMYLQNTLTCEMEDVLSLNCC